MIKSWANVEWYLPPVGVEGTGFWHVSSQIRDMGDTNGLRSGDTVWAAQVGVRHIGMAWEWAEVRPGLVMLADPNAIITNLQLIDSLGAAVLGLSKTVAINRLVHALPWQTAVADLLRACMHAKPSAPERETPTSKRQGPPFFAPDTTAPAAHAAPVTAAQPMLPARQTAPSAYEPPALQHFNERRLRNDGTGRNRASDREEFSPQTQTQALRRAA